ncbi:hypothetical protein GCM10010449_54670 [Streptomyces rectiviolaceus]|uniref:Uncharacterized protein n=1 Tax=Streptomyces rectiviolaceus TaxID=332591 RepID=A0ABP6MUC3_9ACTN
MAAGVLAGLAGPATAASAATGFDGGGALHGVHVVTYAVDFSAGRPGGEDPSSTSTSTSTASPDGENRDPEGTIADAGAGVLPWIAAAAAGALGVGAVVFAMIRRRSE